MTSRTTRFETLLEAVPEALVGMDQKGTIQFVNRQTESLFGFDRTQLIGEPVETLVAEPLWQIYAQHRDDYFADPRTRSSGLELELSGRRRDGTDFPINVTLAHIDTGDVLLAITAVSDVVRQKRAVKNAELTAAVVEYSDDAIISATLKGIITSWNPGAERLYGYSSREIIGKSAKLLTPEDRADEFPANLARVRDGHVVEHFETVRVRKDGSRVPVSLTVAPIRDDDGAIVGLSVVHRDVTRQRQAFEAAQRISAIVESSDDSITGSTLDRIVTSWNPAAERMFGYRSEEVVGRSIDLLIPEDRSEEARAVSARIGAGEHVDCFETTRVRKDGTVFPISLTLSPIRDATGTVVGVSAISRDMTELKHAAEYSRSLIEANLDPLVTISREGKITDLNEATVTAIGVPRERLIGTDFSQYATKPDKAREAFRLTYEQGSVTDYPLTLRHHPDGALTDVLYNASVYRDLNGDVLGVLAAARDVTVQKRAFRTAQHMAAIVEGSDDAIISGTLDGLITTWNPAAERMYGYSGAEVIGRPATLLTPPDRADEITNVLEQIRAGRRVECLESRRVRKDGTVFPVSVTVSPIHDADGAVVGTSVIHRDLTEEKAALASSQQMAAIVEYSQDAIISRTIDGIVTSWNPAAERMFGYSGAEMIGRSIDLIIPSEQAGEQISLLAKLSAGRPVENWETTRVRKDGTRFAVSLTLSPLRDDHGAIVGASAICRDITALKHAAHYARSLIEAALDPLVTISPEGKVTDVNEATVKATGVPRKKLIGSDFSHYFSDPERAHAAYEQAFAQGAVTGYPLTLRHRDGTLTDVQYNASVYRDAGGNVLGVFAAAREVTGQHIGGR